MAERLVCHDVSIYKENAISSSKINELERSSNNGCTCLHTRMPVSESLRRFLSPFHKIHIKLPIEKRFHLANLVGQMDALDILRLTTTCYDASDWILPSLFTSICAAFAVYICKHYKSSSHK